VEVDGLRTGCGRANQQSDSQSRPHNTLDL
jgi:hypothetical protein